MSSDTHYQFGFTPADDSQTPTPRQDLTLAATLDAPKPRKGWVYVGDDADEVVRDTPFSVQPRQDDQTPVTLQPRIV